MKSVEAMSEVITLVSLSQEVLRDIMLKCEEDDPTLMAIYCDALAKLGILLQDVIVSIAVYCGAWIDPINCEGTD